MTTAEAIRSLRRKGLSLAHAGNRRDIRTITGEYVAEGLRLSQVPDWIELHGTQYPELKQAAPWDEEALTTKNLMSTPDML